MLHRHTCNVNLALAREATTPVKKKKKQQLKKKQKKHRYKYLLQTGKQFSKKPNYFQNEITW